jgi:hypothetical protein
MSQKMLLGDKELFCHFSAELGFSLGGLGAISIVKRFSALAAFPLMLYFKGKKKENIFCLCLSLFHTFFPHLLGFFVVL